MPHSSAFDDHEPIGQMSGRVAKSEPHRSFARLNATAAHSQSLDTNTRQHGTDAGARFVKRTRE